MLIISDRSNNVKRVLSIIRRIDLASDDEIEVVPLQHASSAEVVRVLTQLMQAPRSDGMRTGYRQGTSALSMRWATWSYGRLAAQATARYRLNRYAGLELLVANW